MSKNDEIIDIIIKKIKNRFISDGSGHDFEHIIRVYKLAKHIAKKEKCDEFVVSIAALLHDIGDYKLSKNNKENHSEEITELLKNTMIYAKTAETIIEIAEGVSYRGANIEDTKLSLEGCCVRDADRLDAMGAIGVARAFAYGALNQRKMYDKNVNPILFDNFESYKNNNSNTINHFYEKLLLLKKRMQTTEGKKIAIKRHQFLKSFITNFLSEWEFVE